MYNYSIGILRQNLQNDSAFDKKQKKAYNINNVDTTLVYMLDYSCNINY